MPSENTSGDSAPLKIREPILGRDRLARLVVVGSFLTVFLLAGALLALAQGGNAASADAASKAFNTILPVLASWVGTVLAFYFSSANQEHTNDILDKAISRASGANTIAPSAPVSEKMIPQAKIHGLQDLKDRKPADIPISELQRKFEGKLPNGAAVTRLIFVENGVFKFVLHASTLNSFVVHAKPAENATFEDLLKYEDLANQISKLVVFVSAASTLAAAKMALERVSGAQDIIVTTTGNATEPMLGWLSNVDLTKALPAS
jgi:hypothetical protein